MISVFSHCQNRETRDMNAWWNISTAESLAELDSDASRGLSDREAQRRLDAYGPNALEERGIKSPWVILREQFTGVLIVVLIAAAIVSAALGEYADAAVIFVIVVLNALLGLSQEYRAEKAMAALRRMSVPTVKVRRNGGVQEISSRDLAPGDILFLEAGNLVPADCRLLETANLRVQEAALTGESEPVEKNVARLEGAEVALGDRRNMAYMGTIVTYGRGLALITATGMRTELGGIATLIQGVKREATPLQKRLDQLGKGLALAALALVAVIFFQGLIRGGLGMANVKLMFLTAISMAVAAVPEGLPAVVTIALALGAQRMLSRRTLIRKLLAVETLGSVTVICSDKTGTLTENRMTVTVLDVGGDRIDLTERLGRDGPVWDDQTDRRLPLDGHPGIGLLLTAGALCNDAILKPRAGRNEHLQAIGDPTEGALVVAAAAMGLFKQELEQVFQRVDEIPFDSDRKRMTTVHSIGPAVPPDLAKAMRADDGGRRPDAAFCKGAVDSLLDVCAEAWTSAGARPLTADRRKEILAANDALAQAGMRVLGVAFRLLDGGGVKQDLERNMVFLGLIGMIDPPRQEVRAAVQTCRTAGIRPVMITGDHPLTAREIARQLGIAADGAVLTGADLDKLSPAELYDRVEDTAVYARVSPEHKLKIIQALQQRGHVVAMTGDGVNDAPALRKSDIGVAMGITGTDVTKEVADMVLQDDNFATIVAAVEEGRAIYDNIRKFIKYLLSTNSGELWVMLLAPFMGMPLPLLPIQILWMNLVTDGLPALALSVEPAERDIMRRRPRRLTDNILGQGMGWHILWVGLLMCAVSLGAGYWVAGLGKAHGGGQDVIAHFRTVVFTTLTFLQLAHVMAIRSNRQSLFTVGVFTNKPLLGAVLLTIVLQLALVYAPFLQKFFQTAPLSAFDLAICAVLSSTLFWAVELEKFLLRRKAPA
ncbi:MAG: cation-translocating P-type ATPase [Kiritimatiellia bacterium]